MTIKESITLVVDGHVNSQLRKGQCMKGQGEHEALHCPASCAAIFIL